MSKLSDSLLPVTPVSRPPEYGAAKNRNDVHTVQSEHDRCISFHSVSYEIGRYFRPKKLILNSVRLVNLGRILVYSLVS